MSQKSAALVLTYQQSDHFFSNIQNLNSETMRRLMCRAPLGGGVADEDAFETDKSRYVFVRW